jgi:hypothetical protein
MIVDHHELRSALGRFFEAKRALRQAYRRCVASHGPAESRAMRERGASEQAGNHPTLSEELRELKDENERLRKSLTLLHAHSLRLQDQLDTVLVQKDTMSGACEAVASGLREASRADGYPRVLGGADR